MRAVLFIAIAFAGCPDNGPKGPPPGNTTGGGTLEPATALPAAPQNATREGVKFTPGVQLSSSVQLLDSGVTSQSFNFVHLGLLWVRIGLAGMGRTTIVSLKLVSDRGNVMHDADLPFTTDPTVTEMNMTGMEHTVLTIPAKQVPGGWYLDYPIAIAGSHMTRYPDPGNWQLIALVQDSGQTFTVPFHVTFAQ
jgi:hypothetical protein